MAAVLVTLAQAKLQAGITTAPADPGDPVLQLWLDAAESIVLDYINSTAWWRVITATWLATPSTAPLYVVQSILIQFMELRRFRGDDLDTPAVIDGQMSVTVTRLLMRTRDPVVDGPVVV